MLVQRMPSPVTRLESWTVLGDDGAIAAGDPDALLREQK